MEGIGNNFTEKSGSSESTRRSFECFSDSDEMAGIRSKIIEVGVESDEFGELYGRYQELGESIADSISGMQGRIELMVKSAQIIAELGLRGDAIEALEEAYYAAQQEGLTELIELVSGEIAQLESNTEEE